MSETPIEPENRQADDAGGHSKDEATAQVPDPDEGQREDLDPVQTGAPATGPDAPVPPTRTDDTDQPGA